MNLGLKSECCEKWRSQMALKMLEVYSSRRDQQFWILNHSISSSYEEVMIKVSKQKSWTFLQNFPIWYCSSSWKWREDKTFKGKRRREILSNQKRPFQPSPCVGRVCHTVPEGRLGRVAHGLHTWWPCHGLCGASPAHLSHSSTVFGPPNSEFKSVFRLRTMTPSCTTMTMKLR